MRRITTVTVLSVAGVLVAAGAAAALNAQVLGGREGPRVGSVDTLLPQEFVSPDAQLTTVPAEPTEPVETPSSAEPSESSDDDASATPTRSATRTARPASSSTTEAGDDKGGDSGSSGSDDSGSSGSGSSGSGSSGSGGGSDDSSDDD